MSAVPRYDRSLYEPVEDDYDTSLFEPVGESYDTALYEPVKGSPRAAAAAELGTNIGKGVVGGAEALLQLGTSFAGAVPATVAAAGEVALGMTPRFSVKPDGRTDGEKFVERFHGVQDALTYEPRTEAGIETSAFIGEKLGQVSDVIDKTLVEPNLERGDAETAIVGKVAGEGLLLSLGALGARGRGVRGKPAKEVIPERIREGDDLSVTKLPERETAFDKTLYEEVLPTEPLKPVEPKPVEAVRPTEIEVGAARAESAKSVADLFVEDKKTGTTLYSGLPIEDFAATAKQAGKSLQDKLGIAAKGVEVIKPETAKALTPLDHIKSPRKVVEKFPELKPIKEMADRSVIVQDTLRDSFLRRLKVIDESLGGGFARVKDFSKSYNRNKESLREIFLAEDYLGKSFTRQELVKHFKASPAVIKAHSLTRSALAHALTFVNESRELRGKEKVEGRGGYIPHFFHEFTVKVGNKVVGSARTQAEAISIGNKIARGGESVTITPKQFNFPGSDVQAAIVGDSKYFSLKKGLEDAFSISAEEASAVLSDVARLKGRSRYFGNLMQRRGVGGWEKNLDYAIPHYLNMVSRYVAMDQFKSKAISHFERNFGEFGKEYTGVKKYQKDYINDMLGVPSKIEGVVENSLRQSKIISNMFDSYLGPRAVMQIAGATTKATTVVTFGFMNVSAALVNMFQLHMGYSLLGAKWISQGIARTTPIVASTLARKAGFPASARHDIGILRQLDVEIAQGLESAGYSKFNLGKLSEKTLFLWTWAEWGNRASVGLGAYYKGLSQGMTKPEAIQFARDANTKVNFNYSVSDAPNIMRRLGPVGSSPLQFKKFPIKAVEFISELKGIEKARFWFPFLTFAGLYGIPGAEGVKNLFNWLSGGVDLELEFKKSMMDWAGDDAQKQAIAKTILYGAFSNEELGGVDISKRVGLGDFIPADSSDLLGPFFSKSVRAIQLAAEGNVVETVRSIAPGLGNPLLAITDESKTSPLGRDRLITPLDTKDRANRAAGFRSAKEAIETDKSRIIKYETANYNERKRHAIDALIKAAKALDSKKIREASDQIKELGVQITDKDISRELLQKTLTSSQRAYLNAPDIVKGETSKVFNFSKEK